VPKELFSYVPAFNRICFPTTPAVGVRITIDYK